MFNWKLIWALALNLIAIEASTVIPIAHDPRIVGGVPATIETSKHVVSIRLKDRDSYFGEGHICGGTLISNRLVLTATHCLVNFQLDPPQIRRSYEFVVVMGILDRRDQENDYIFSSEVMAIAHKQFEIETMRNDVAVMLLKVEVPKKHETIMPIPMASPTPAVGTKCWVHGWGALGWGTSGSYELRMVEVPILNNTACQTGVNEHKIYPGMMCAGYKEGGKDACQGDSGGPLICNNKLVGVVSWGEECALADYPGIYSEVKYFKTWIDQHSTDDRKVSLNDSKYFASIHLKLDDLGKTAEGHFAGGALIKVNNSYQVVTTAHSLYYDSGILISPEKLTVVFGSVKRNNPLPWSLTSEVKEIRIHEEFNAETQANDIAILVLNKTIIIENGTVPIELFNSSTDSYQNCSVLGYGFNTARQGEEDLHYSKVEVISRNLCNQKYQNGLRKDWLCGGSMDKLQDEYQADTGGPLVCNGKLVGLMIERKSFAVKGFPSWYTNVDMHRNWIYNITKNSNETTRGLAGKPIICKLIVFIVVLKALFMY